MANIIARLKEPSTWAAIAGALAALGINIPSGTWQAITGVVAVLAGVAGAVMAEKG